METHEIEAWAMRIVERVKSRQPVEDSLVELKSEWISPEKAARRIAGHANSAHGSNILWLIGVDEKHGIIGVEANELSNWYNMVKSQFDGVPPSLSSVNVQITDKTVVAILLETNGAPYLVKNPAFGKEKGNSIKFEVPWREGTSTRSATREDLLKILAPAIRKPKIELLGGILDARLMEKKDWDDSPDKFEWKLRLFLYIEPSTSERVVIPFHRCEGGFYFLGTDKKYRFRWVSLEPSSVTWLKKHRGDDTVVESRTIKHSITMENTTDELLINGPGKCFLYGSAFSLPMKISHPETVSIDLMLYFSNDAVGFPIQVSLPQSYSMPADALYSFYWLKNFPKETDEILE